VPEDLAEYQTAKVFWQNLGVGKTELDNWDEDEVQRYLTIMDVESKFQTFEAKRDQARKLAEQRSGRVGGS
jgi:hypothetical protein